MNRRDFVAGATVVFVVPAIHLLPSPKTSAATNQSRAVFMIHGWSIHDDRTGGNQAWISIGNSWRTAWR